MIHRIVTRRRCAGLLLYGMQNGPKVIAHRGASAYAREHSLAAYDLAIEQGADALELDVRATADGGLVVLHDRTLRRTARDPRADRRRTGRRPPRPRPRGAAAVVRRAA